MLLLIGVAGIVLQTSYAQTDVTTSEQTTLSNDLANNPVAQDILRKIEQTKKWIENLEQRNYDNLEKQKELEAKRVQSLERLNQDLADWESLWEYYSPQNSFERFVDKIPDSQVQDVFWDQFEFKEQKVKAGRDAFKQVLTDGGSRRDALQAYFTASETKRIELIEANSQFNVNHNLAYYNQQILFDKNGQIVDLPVTGEVLREYYEDYKTNPTYLDANPNDKLSWEDLGKTNPDTQCREGKIVIHRFQTNDYVCVTVSTAEMWIQHGMGEITGDSEESNSNNQYLVTPLTKCDDGFSVIFNTDTKKYSCISDETAKDWMEKGIAEIHSSEDYIIQSINQKDSSLRIHEINQQILEMKKDLENNKIELKKTYDKKYDELLVQSKIDEKNTIQDFNERSGMSKKELSIKISEIRKQHKSEKENILDDKIKDSKELEKEYDAKMAKLVTSYDQDPYIKIVLNSGKIAYEAVARD